MERDIEPIEESPVYRKKLEGLVHDRDTLRRAGYILQSLSPADIERKKRCRRCNRALNKSKIPPRARGNQTAPGPAEVPSIDKLTLVDGISPDPSKQPCRFHGGFYSQRAWSCCQGTTFSKPCQGAAEHEPRHYRTGELETEWRYYATPSMAEKPDAPVAVAIDCEMGTAESGESELIRVSVVDYFSGAVLLDRLVYPQVRMTHFNTAFSGVTRKMMEDARRKKICLFGRNQARKAIYELIGPSTIVIGHGGHGDLSSLRWIHPFVIDTLVLEKNRRAEDELAAAVLRAENAVNEPEAPETLAGPAQIGGLSLKALAKERLERVIQVKGKGHDSTEDALATRDLLHWYINQMLRTEKEAAQVPI